MDFNINDYSESKNNDSVVKPDLLEEYKHIREEIKKLLVTKPSNRGCLPTEFLDAGFYPYPYLVDLFGFKYTMETSEVKDLIKLYERQTELYNMLCVEKDKCAKNSKGYIYFNEPYVHTFRLFCNQQKEDEKPKKLDIKLTLDILKNLLTYIEDERLCDYY